MGGSSGAACRRRAFTLVVFNGNAGNRAYRASLAQAFRERGLAVLLFDYRGFGGNAGHPDRVGPGGGRTRGARVSGHARGCRTGACGLFRRVAGRGRRGRARPGVSAGGAGPPLAVHLTGRGRARPLSVPARATAASRSVGEPRSHRGGDQPAGGHRRRSRQHRAARTEPPVVRRGDRAQDAGHRARRRSQRRRISWLARKSSRRRCDCCSGGDRARQTTHAVLDTGNVSGGSYPSHAVVRPGGHRLRPRRTAGLHPRGKAGPARRPRRAQGADWRHLHQHRHHPEQDDARGRAASVRLPVPGHLRRQLPREREDHHGGPLLQGPAGDQERDRRHAGATLPQRHHAAQRRRQLRGPANDQGRERPTARRPAAPTRSSSQPARGRPSRRTCPSMDAPSCKAIS